MTYNIKQLRDKSMSIDFFIAAPKFSSVRYKETFTINRIKATTMGSLVSHQLTVQEYMQVGRFTHYVIKFLTFL